MPINFKFSKEGIIRRATFPSSPSWKTLADKIHLYFKVPRDRIAVSYLDAEDGDDPVTLSSDEELSDYYERVPLGDTIKFSVVDLGARPFLTEGKPLPATPLGSSSRNTFSSFGGGPSPLIIEVEEDGWDRFGFGDILGSTPIRSNESGPHAFVETVDTDVDASSLGHEDGSNVSFKSSTLEGKGDKGKARDMQPTVSDDDSSSVSVIDADAPDKPDIHVPVHSLRGFDSGTFGRSSTTSLPSAQPHLRPDERPLSSTSTTRPTDQSQKHSTASSEHLNRQSSINDNANPTAAPGHIFDDPPLPDIPAPSSATSASLVNDIASLLDSISAVFTTHPELSENLRTILRNTTNGAYWAGSRESVASAMADLRRAAEETRNATTVSVEQARIAEQEAGRRVAETLGSMFRSIGEVTAQSPQDGHRLQPTSPPTAVGGPRSLPFAPPPPPSMKRNFKAYSPQRDFTPYQIHPWHRFDHPVPPPPPPPHMYRGWNGIPSEHMAFPPPPPPPFIPSMPLNARPPAQAQAPHRIPVWNQFRPYPYIPPPTAPIIPERPTTSESPRPEPPEVSYYAASPMDRAREQARMAELRTSLDAAKQTYKKEKARYRKEREERKKRRDHMADTSFDAPTALSEEASITDSGRPRERSKSVQVQSPAVSPSATQVISNARDGFPQMEMFSLPHSPRRHHTVGGYHDSNRRVVSPIVENTDILKRQIIRRLSDLEMTEHGYPDLKKVLEARLPSGGKKLTQLEEDDLVSEIVDELLTLGGNEANEPPRASGSGIGRGAD